MTPEGLPTGGTSVRDPYVTNTFFRAEYLNLSIQPPGGALLGAQVAGVNAYAPFDVVDTFGDLVGTAQIPNLSPIKLNDTVGVRNTFGWEFLNGGSVEFNAFVTENSIMRLGQESLPAGQLYATSLLINGSISDGATDPNLLFYNQSYTARYSSRVWGAEVNYLWDPGHFSIFEYRPLAGVRYVNLYEKIQQRGSFLPDFGDVVNTSIDTWAYNNIAVAQVGFRLEAVTKYLTFGVEPKIGMGPNFAMAKVRTDQLRSSSDGEYITQDHTGKYTTLMDLNGYVRWRCTDNLTFSIGYMMTYLGTAIRATESTYYNDPGNLSQPPGVVAAAQKTDIYWRGLTVGGEVKW